MEHLGLSVVGKADVGKAYIVPVDCSGFGGLRKPRKFEESLRVGNNIRHEVHLVETRPQIGDGHHDCHCKDTGKCKLCHGKGPSQIKRNPHRHHAQKRRR